MKNILIIGLMLTLVSCSTTNETVDTRHTATIKRVAIIGFEINQRQPIDRLGLGDITTLANHGSLSDAPEMKVMAERSYESLRSTIEAVTTWKVMSLTEMKRIKAYNNYVIQEMTGMQSTWGAGKGYEQFVPAGTLDHHAVVSRMERSKRDELARALGVDAVISVIQYQDIDQSLFDFSQNSKEADYSYTTSSSLVAFAPGSVGPIWQVANIQGEPVSSHKYKSRERLKKISLAGIESSTSSTKALIKKYSR